MVLVFDTGPLQGSRKSLSVAGLLLYGLLCLLQPCRVMAQAQTYPTDPSAFLSLPLDTLLKSALEKAPPGPPISLTIASAFTFTAAPEWAPYNMTLDHASFIIAGYPPESGLQSPWYIQNYTRVLLHAIPNTTVNISRLIPLNTDLEAPVGPDNSTKFLKPTFVSLEPGSLLIMNTTTHPVSCARLAEYQQFGCNIRDGLGGIEVNPNYVFVSSWVSPGFIAENINVTCRTDLEDLPPPPCITARASSGAEFVQRLSDAAATELNPTSDIPYPVRLYIRGNITIPANIVPVAFSGRMLVLGQPDRPTELNLNLQSRFVELMPNATLTLARLTLVNLAAGLDSAFPNSMMLGTCNFAVFDRAATGSRGFRMQLTNVSLVVPPDLITYLAYWSAQQRARNTSATWIASYPAYASQLGQVLPTSAATSGQRSLLLHEQHQQQWRRWLTQSSDGTLALSLNQTGYGTYYNNVLLTSVPLLTSLMMPTSGITALSIDPYAPPNTLQPIFGGAAELAAALAAPTTHNLVLMSNVTVGDTSLGWPAGGVTVRAVPNSTVTLAGRPGMTTVIDFRGGVSLIRLGEGQPALYLSALTLVNMGTLLNASTTAPPGYEAGLLQPSALGAYSSIMWPFAFDRARQSALSLLPGTTMVVPPAEYAVLAALLRSQTAKVYRVAGAILRPQLAAATGVFPVGNTTPPTTTVSQLVFRGGGQVWDGAALTAQLPIAYQSVLGNPVICCDSDGGKGLSGGQIAVIAVCTVVGSVLICAALVIWLVLRRRDQRHQAELKAAADKARIDVELAAAAAANAARTMPFGMSHQMSHQGASSGTSWMDVVKASAKQQGYDGYSGEHGGASSDTPESDLGAMIKRLQQDVHMQQVVIEDVLGRGGYGVVYKGKWRNLTVAVKTLLFQETAGGGQQSQARSMALSEAAINTSLIHSHIVNTYAYELENLDRYLQSGQDDPFVAKSADGPRRLTSDWKLYIVQEYCDAGNLADVIDQGLFFDTLPDGSRGPVNLGRVLDVSMGVAQGMTHIHMNKIIHGDLGPRNVMLQTEPGRKRSPWLAKVGDFGLSRKLAHGQSHFSNARQGTPFYTAPEVQRTGMLAKESDVYAFGVLLHEMYYGTPVWRQPDVPFTGAPLQHSLIFDETCPPSLAALAQECVDADPKKRPTFSEIFLRLEDIELQSNGKLLPHHSSEEVLPFAGAEVAGATFSADSAHVAPAGSLPVLPPRPVAAPMRTVRERLAVIASAHTPEEAALLLTATSATSTARSKHSGGSLAPVAEVLGNGHDGDEAAGEGLAAEAATRTATSGGGRGYGNALPLLPRGGGSGNTGSGSLPLLVGPAQSISSHSAPVAATCNSAASLSATSGAGQHAVPCHSLSGGSSSTPASGALPPAPAALTLQPGKLDPAKLEAVLHSIVGPASVLGA